MIKYYGDALSGKLSCTYNEMAGIAGLTVDQTKRVIRALNGDVLVWDAPFAGRSIEIIAPTRNVHEIDFKILKEKFDFDLDRLQQIIKYTNSYDCRQRFITDYFGEDVNSWRCGSCDSCTNSRKFIRRR
jgi:ATP-dependent DNA helicase RecQ